MSDHGQQPPPSLEGMPADKSNERSEIRNKKQRLLLLYHASKCPLETGCTVTRHCAEMKRLWHHMENGCRDKNCTVSHCLSSRYILHHFRNCKHIWCPPCRFIRQIAQKSKHPTSISNNVFSCPLTDQITGTSGSGSNTLSLVIPKHERELVDEDCTTVKVRNSVGETHET